MVQFGAFHGETNAKSVFDKLQAVGVTAQVIAHPPLFLVRSAPLGHDAATAMAAKAKAAAGIDGFVFATK